MSSSDLGNQLSKLGALASLGFKAAKLSVSPVTATMRGMLVSGRFFAYTTVGRATIFVVILLGTFTYFKLHFTAVERHKWEVGVAKKQEEIIAKVVDVNKETRLAQEKARQQVGFMDRILAVVVDGIWKVQEPHPIAAETIDLINETRGRPDAPPPKRATPTN